MANGMYVAASGTVGRLMEMEVLSQNLAHARQAGFKRDAVTFHEVQSQLRGGAPVDEDKGYVQVDDPVARLDEGPLVETGNPLDVAIAGPGFLRVETSAGERLTRNGRMMVGVDGSLRTTSGLAVLDDRGRRIQLPPDRAPEIGPDGTIRAGELLVGRIGVAPVDLEQTLQRDPMGLFIPPEVAPVTRGETHVLQGFIEESNIQPIRVMTELIEVQRHYEALHQVISTYRQMDEAAARLPR